MNDDFFTIVDGVIKIGDGSKFLSADFSKGALIYFKD